MNNTIKGGGGNTKIAITSSSIYPSRRSWVYGSESQPWLLAETLGKMGHEVYFYGASGSEKSQYFKKFRYLHSSLANINKDNEAMAIDYYSDELDDTDIVLDFSPTGIVSEYIAIFGHGRWIHTRNGTTFIYPRLAKYRNMVVLSPLAQALAKEQGINTEVIPYGIDQDFYTLNEDADRQYFLYLSRPHPDKGVFQFIEIAKRLRDVEFKIAFSMASEEHRYYGESVISELPENVEYIDENHDIDGKKKVKLYQNAKALLIPLQRSYIEAFGLVFAEAMACGTPFITNMYSIDVSQWKYAILTSGSTEEYVMAIRNFKPIDPRILRQWVLDNYSKEIFANNYLKLAEKVINGYRW